jgi:hypothetical protein
MKNGLAFLVVCISFFFAVSVNAQPRQTGRHVAPRPTVHTVTLRRPTTGPLPPAPAPSPFAPLVASDFDQNRTGDAVGDAFGYGGLGAAGSGWGGGGTGESNIGMGGLGTMGHGSGAGSDQGYSSGADRGLRNRPTPVAPVVAPQPPTAQPTAPTDPFPRVGAAQVTLLQRCQDAERTRHSATTPANTVVVRFSVGPRGTVTGARLAQGGEVHDPTFHTCVTDIVRRWTFPASTETQDHVLRLILEPRRR